MAFETSDGGGVRNALRWLAEQRRADPAAPRMKLIDEAGRRFDLTPLEVEFLVNAWTDEPPAAAP